jgi:hypothetical protein
MIATRRLVSDVTFKSQWTIRGISYAAEIHEGYLLWASAPAGASLPESMTRVDPSSFTVLSRTGLARETVIVAITSGREVTVVIPHIVLGGLEHAWKRLNSPTA